MDQWGLEPQSNCLQGNRFSHLSYQPVAAIFLAEYSRTPASSLVGIVSPSQHFHISEN